MNISLLMVPAVIALVLPSCVADNSSAGINGRRSQSGNLTSYSQLNQNRVQRANEGEESDHGVRMRYNQRDETLSPLKTANEGLGLLNNVKYGLNGLGL